MRPEGGRFVILSTQPKKVERIRDTRNETATNGSPREGKKRNQFWMKRYHLLDGRHLLLMNNNRANVLSIAHTHAPAQFYTHERGE